MADVINFTLPSFNSTTTEGDIKQIKSYLYTLTEQMKFYLNNIDADNYNDEYQKKMAAFVEASRTNSIKASIVQETMRKTKNEYYNSLKNAVAEISGNLGGYIVTLDLDNDGHPDDLRILVDTYDYKTATKYWQFNRAGLAFIEKNGNELTAHLALTDDGFIAADRIKGVIGDFVTLNACTLNACVGNFSGTITAIKGQIGGWNIENEKIYQRRVYGDKTYEVVLKSDTTNSDNKKVFYCNVFTDGRNSDSYDADSYKTETFYIRRNGEVKLAAGQIGAWNIDNIALTKQGGLYSDYHGSVYHFRVFLQPAYWEANDETACNYQNAGKTFVFSTQTAKNGDDNYKATFIVYANGEVKCNNGISATIYKDVNDYELISYNSNHYIFGYGAYRLGVDTYLEGKDVLLRCNSGSTVKIQEGSTTRLSLGAMGWIIGSETEYIKRDTIESAGGLVISANRAKNAIHMIASNIGLRCNTVVHGNLTITSATKLIGFTAPSSGSTYTLGLNHNCEIVAFTSSKRYKENITDTIDDELNPHNLYNLPIKQYNYKNEFSNISLVQGKQIGFIAEDVEKYYPVACIKNVMGQVESWQDRIIIPAMMLLIQELHNEIELIKARR